MTRRTIASSVLMLRERETYMRDVCQIEQLLLGRGLDKETTRLIIDELEVLPKLKVTSSRVRIIENTAVALIVLRCRQNGKRTQRTLYSGMNVFSQLMARYGVPANISLEIQLLVREDVEKLERKVREATSRLTSDKEVVEGVRDRFRVLSKKAKQVKRTNLIATMTALLTVGWTREEIITCLDEATCKNILES